MPAESEKAPGGTNSSQFFVQARENTLVKFVLYETKPRYYLVGSNRQKTCFKVLKIDRTLPHDLAFMEDPEVYSRAEIQQLLEMIEHGNKASGGMKKTCVAFGVLGFIRFMQGYYMLLISRKSKVGAIGSHFVYSIDDTIYVPIPHPSYKLNNNPNEEMRYKGLFFGMDVTKFYFSYTYDITHTLQHNMTCRWKSTGPSFNARFMWNNYLLKPLRKSNVSSQWILPVIHGYFNQTKYSVFGRTVSLTLLSRRSRYFAGARFLKRGVTEDGKVANDVESEQILHEVSAGNKSFRNFSSFVQIRGSIPLFWSQDTTGMHPKPPIIVQRVDPYYNATILHFEDLFRRYSSPVVIVNLVKAQEKKPRETILLKEFGAAIDFLNNLLPPEHRIVYYAWDFHKAAKSKQQNPNEPDAISYLNGLFSRCLSKVGFFHSGKHFKDGEETGRTQSGVVRTNCIDSLDRTNAAQFVLAKCALGYQLHAMGMRDIPEVDFDEEIVVLLMAMYQDMGNHIALQYAGSHLVNTMQTYSINNAHNIASHSRDLLVTIKRYYSNSFTDAEKQDSINLFLGNYIPWIQAPRDGLHLWELESDYYLHNRKCGENILLAATPWWRKPIEDFKRGVDKVGQQAAEADDSRTSSSSSQKKREEEEEAKKRETTETEIDDPEAGDASSSSSSDGEAPNKQKKKKKKTWEGKGGSFEDFYRVHTITLFDKELSFNFNEAELSESSQLQLQQQKGASNAGELQQKVPQKQRVTLKTFMDQNNPPGAQYINGMKRWLSWWAQSRDPKNNKDSRESSAREKTSGFNKRQESRSREVVNDYGISIRQDPREVGFYKKYVDMNQLSTATEGTEDVAKPEDPDHTMDAQIYRDYIGAKDDPGRFICCSRPNLSYEAFLAQDFSHYAPSPQDATIYANACETSFDSVGAYAAYSAHSHARVASPHHE